MANWFLAKLIYKINLAGKKENFEYDEQLRLIEATSLDEALIKSNQVGLENEFSINNKNSNTIKWEFVDVLDIIPLPKLENGIEIYSITNVQENSNLFEKMVHDRAQKIGLQYKIA